MVKLIQKVLNKSWGSNGGSSVVPPSARASVRVPVVLKQWDSWCHLLCFISVV